MAAGDGAGPDQETMGRNRVMTSILRIEDHQHAASLRCCVMTATPNRVRGAREEVKGSGRTLRKRRTSGGELPRSIAPSKTTTRRVGGGSTSRVNLSGRKT